MRHPLVRDGWPMVTNDDLRSFLGFVLFVGIFIALTAVSQ